MMQEFTGLLENCECCPRKCGVNRLAGKVGPCRIGAQIQISHAGLHFGEEPPLSGTRGSGTIFFCGCNLRCVFCQNYQISQEFRQGRTRTLTAGELATEMLRLQGAGAHNINFVSPTHMIYQMADAIALAKTRGLAIPVVYNSNGYDSLEALRLIRGLVDIYLPDIKYMEDELGKRYSAVRDYAEVVPAVLGEMLDQVGHLELDAEGIAVRGLLVRHLVLPAHLENSRKCLRFLADLSPQVFVSIMAQYSPQYRAAEFPERDRTLTVDEYDQILDFALDLGLENAFIQEPRSQTQFLPDFARDHPFNSA
jgi:putative pyruvate formate lyase activating enzyme